MRASDPAHVPTHPPAPKRPHLLCENAPTFLSPKFKSAIIHYILSKRRPYVVFGGTAFWRTAFCRRKEKRAFHYAYFTTASGIDPCAPSQTAEFAAISGFAARIISFPVYDRVSKNTRRFRALSAFEKSPLTSTHIRKPFLAALALLTPRLQSSSATLRARCLVLFAAPQSVTDLLTFDPSKQCRLLELILLRGFYRNTPSKTPSGGIFVENFLPQTPLAPARFDTRADALCARKTVRKKSVKPRSCAKLFVDRRSGSRLRIMRAYYTIPTRRRQRFLIIFSHSLSRVYASAFMLVCVIFLL